jgi:hypothetical protein
LDEPPPPPPFRLMSHLANLQIFSLVAMSWTERSRCVIFSVAVIMRGPRNHRQWFPSAAARQPAPCSHTAYLSRLQMFGSFVFHLAPAVAGLIYVHVPSNVCLSLLVSLSLARFRLFSAHLQNPRTFLIQVIAHTPPLAPQGCTLYDTRSLPPSPLLHHYPRASFYVYS